MKTSPPIPLDVAEVEELLARIAPQVAKEDHARLTWIVATLIAVTRLVRKGNATIARLRRMLGQTSSEKTSNVVGANKAAADSTSEGASAAGSEHKPNADSSTSGRQ